MQKNIRKILFYFKSNALCIYVLVCICALFLYGRINECYKVKPNNAARILLFDCILHSARALQKTQNEHLKNIFIKIRNRKQTTTAQYWRTNSTDSDACGRWSVNVNGAAKQQPATFSFGLAPPFQFMDELSTTVSRFGIIFCWCAHFFTKINYTAIPVRRRSSAPAPTATQMEGTSSTGPTGSTRSSTTPRHPSRTEQQPRQRSVLANMRRHFRCRKIRLFIGKLYYITI